MAQKTPHRGVFLWMSTRLSLGIGGGQVAAHWAGHVAFEVGPAFAGEVVHLAVFGGLEVPPPRERLHDDAAGQHFFELGFSERSLRTERSRSPLGAIWKPARGAVRSSWDAR